MHGGGEGVGCTHAFELVSWSPGIRVDDFVVILVVSDDEAHVTASALGNALFRKDSDLEGPEERSASVNVVADLLLESIEGSSLGAHFTEAWGVASREELLVGQVDI